MKGYQLASIAIASFLISSNVHYLLTILNSQSLKLLCYSAVLIVAIMSVILDDSFSQYFGTTNQGIIAIFGTIATSIFLGAAYRAFALKEQLEGYLLVSVIGCFWVVLLGLYIKLLFTQKVGSKHQW